jgi:crossover junction endodeoxyribonuclease RuvC
MTAMNRWGTQTGKNGWFRVLGVDPAASGPTGYGIIESDGRCCRMLHFGALSHGRQTRLHSSGAALQEVHELISGLIREYSPDAVAVESVFTALNMRTALRLAEVRGVVLLAAAQNGLEVHSYAPREVKANIAGHGHADKRQIQTMVRALLSMNELPEPADASDALAVALCHLQAEQARRRFGLPGRDLTPNLKAQGKATVPANTRNSIQIGGTTRTRVSRIVSTR